MSYQHQADRKLATNLEDKMTENINSQLVIKRIKHWADSANFKGITLIEICGGLTGKYFEMPNASYTKR